MTTKNQTDETYQVKAWQGTFGDNYIERNSFEEWKLESGTESFRRMLKNVEADSILEVGSNVGLNLIFINNLYNGNIKLHAVEPNKKAYNILTSQNSLSLNGSWNCSGFNIPLPDNAIDLVFTKGVLIHIAPADLGRITDEVYRVSGKYILCSEYFSHDPVEIPYHGENGLLFKRDFGAYYMDRFPDLKCIDYGFLWMREYELFANLNWWVFEKQHGSTSDRTSLPNHGNWKH